MNYSLLFYPFASIEGTYNVGDYIQSLAAKQFLPNVNQYLDRENLDKYNGEETKLIANGWYMHNPTNWPPSSLIKPLFVALHINISAKDMFVSSESIEYFKKHGPVGCRDHFTRDLLLSYGVEAYFSGCLTLTLGKTYKNSKKGDKIYFTDVEPYINNNPKIKFKSFFSLLTKYKTIKRIQKKRNMGVGFRSFKNTLKFYAMYSKFFSDEVLENAVYLTQELPANGLTEEDKFNKAKETLSLYTNAKFVVTSRIHCALPCLGMQTPVIYIDDQDGNEISICRLDGLRELFHTISIKDGTLNCSILTDSPNKKIGSGFYFKNKSDYLKLKDGLEKKCVEFIGKEK